MVFDDEGFASAKHTFLPFGVAVYAPQVPYWPIKVGSAPPAAAVAAGSGFAGLGAGFAAGAGGDFADSLAPFAAEPCACARDVASQKAAIATRNVSIRNTDNWFPYHCDWMMARGHIALAGMDSREMLSWEGSYSVVTALATLRPRSHPRIKNAGFVSTIGVNACCQYSLLTLGPSLALLLPLRIGPLQEILGAGTA